MKGKSGGEIWGDKEGRSEEEKTYHGCEDRGLWRGGISAGE